MDIDQALDFNYIANVLEMANKCAICEKITNEQGSVCAECLKTGESYE